MTDYNLVGVDIAVSVLFVSNNSTVETDLRGSGFHTTPPKYISWFFLVAMDDHHLLRQVGVLQMTFDEENLED